MIRLSGADITVKLLERQGIDIIAGIPGGAILPIYDALYRRNKIRHILARNEQGAGFIAQGMARTGNKPGVCMATSGPGATNLLTAIADAKLDSVPIICITGQVSSDLIGKDSFQEVDICAMSRPVTKQSYFVKSPLELLEIIPEAFRLAMSGKPGPVLIDIPKDVQTSIIEFKKWPDPGTADPAPNADVLKIKQAAEMINRAKRPVIYAGGGAARSNACCKILEISRKADIPGTMSLMGLGIFPETYPLSLGMLGMHGTPWANLALEECDLLIAMGTRFDDRATGKVSQFCPDAEIIHIDIDPSEFDKIKNPSISICGDAAGVAELLEPMINSAERKTWIGRINSLKNKYNESPECGNQNCRPLEYISGIAEMLDDNAMVVTDVGQHQMWVAQGFPFLKPNRLITSGGLGTMGFGLPAAMGAALAEPSKQVVCFTGDGSIMMNIQELATIAEQGIDMKVILFNNSALGLVCQQQDLFFEKRFYSSSFCHRPDFAGIARSFGIDSCDLSQCSDPMAALKEQMNKKGTCLINIPVDKDERVFPMVPPGASNSEMINRGEYENRSIAA